MSIAAIHAFRSQTPTVTSGRNVGRLNLVRLNESRLNESFPFINFLVNIPYFTALLYKAFSERDSPGGDGFSVPSVILVAVFPI
jgi:hypothetical protein